MHSVKKIDTKMGEDRQLFDQVTELTNRIKQSCDRDHRWFRLSPSLEPRVLAQPASKRGARDLWKVVHRSVDSWWKPRWTVRRALRNPALTRRFDGFPQLPQVLLPVLRCNYGKFLKVTCGGNVEDSGAALNQTADGRVRGLGHPKPASIRAVTGMLTRYRAVVAAGTTT